MSTQIEIDLKIDDAFHVALKEFGGDKSTDFLITITAERCGVSYGRAIEALERMSKLAEKDDA